MYLFSGRMVARVATAMLVVAACNEPTSTSDVGPFTAKKGGGGGPPAQENRSVTIPDLGGANMISSDTLGAYDGGDCGVKARLDVDTGFFSFLPVDNGLNKKQPPVCRCPAIQGFSRVSRYPLSRNLSQELRMEWAECTWHISPARVGSIPVGVTRSLS